MLVLVHARPFVCLNKLLSHHPRAPAGIVDIAPTTPSTTTGTGRLLYSRIFRARLTSIYCYSSLSLHLLFTSFHFSSLHLPLVLSIYLDLKFC